MMGHRDRTVMVAVDGSEAGVATVRFAAAEAVLRGSPVELVAAYRPHPDEVRRAAGWTPRSAARHRLADAVAAVQVGRSKVRVHAELVMGDLADVVIARSADAALVVVAESGPTGAWQRIAGHCPAPVAVIRSGYRSGGPILVGIDGATVSAAAVDFAYTEAALRGVTLVAVHVWTGLPCTALSGVDPFAYDLTVARSDADRLLSEGLAGRLEQFPDVLVERRVVPAADVGDELIRQTADAAMLVVGSRSPGARSELFLGPVTRFALVRAGCPVTVLNSAPPERRV